MNIQDWQLAVLLLLSWMCAVGAVASGTEASAALAAATAGSDIHGEAASDLIGSDLQRRRGLQEEEQGDHESAVAVDIVQELQQNQRRQLQQDLDRESNRPPAWYGRFDPTYKLSYFAQSMSENKCDPPQDCSRLPGRSYPYHSIVVNPLDPMGDQPVMKIEYPKGSWSPSSDIPGGTLMWGETLSAPSLAPRLLTFGCPPASLSPMLHFSRCLIAFPILPARCLFCSLSLQV